MAEQIPVNLKYYNKQTQVNDHLLPTTKAEQVEESDYRQFVSRWDKERFNGKQDNLGYVPVNLAGDTMRGALKLSNDQIVDARQAVTKQYVDDALAHLVNGAPETLDTLYELADAIGSDPNFAVNMTSIAGNKVDKSSTSIVAEPNKILYLDHNGELNANATSASKLKNAFSLTIEGDVSGETQIDGAENVAISVSIQQFTANDVKTLFTEIMQEEE